MLHLLVLDGLGQGQNIGAGHVGYRQLVGPRLRRALRHGTFDQVAQSCLIFSAGRPTPEARVIHGLRMPKRDHQRSELLLRQNRQHQESVTAFETICSRFAADRQVAILLLMVPYHRVFSDMAGH